VDADAVVVVREDGRGALAPVPGRLAGVGGQRRRDLPGVFGLLLAALVWTVLNPVLFGPPETEDAWMTRAVLAEQWWIREEERSTVGLDYPNVCNAVGALGFCYALYAAYRQRPVGAAVGTVASIGLKFWWLRVLVGRYDAATEAAERR